MSELIFRIADTEKKKVYYPGDDCRELAREIFGPGKWRNFEFLLKLNGEILFCATSEYDNEFPGILPSPRFQVQVGSPFFDKNKKRIWEGDICEHDRLGRFEIKKEDYFYTDPCRIMLSTWNNDDVKIIGNAIESPELMEEGR